MSMQSSLVCTELLHSMRGITSGVLWDKSIKNSIKNKILFLITTGTSVVDTSLAKKVSSFFRALERFLCGLN